VTGHPDDRLVPLVTWFAPPGAARGWTALPRLVIWLSSPALIAGAAGAVSQVTRTIVPAATPAASAVAASTGSLALLFGMIAILVTPMAAVLVLVLSLLRRWRAGVIGVLWAVVIGAMAITLPAIDAALGNWMVLRGAGH
jgi:hypothetical protein